MGDRLEIFIYIAFVVLSLAGGLYKNYAKKKENERERQRKLDANQYKPSEIPVPPPRRSSNPFENFLREQFDLMEEPKTSTVANEMSPPIINENPKTEQAQSIISEGVPAFENTAQGLMSDNMPEEDFSLPEELKDMEEFNYNLSDEERSSMEESFIFDAKYAVIYSEILRKPAF